MALTFFAAACGPNETILRSGSNVSESPAAASTAKPLSDSSEAEVENMRTADFEIILVLRRKDGGVMRSDDKAFIRGITASANRRSLVDSDRAVVIGSNAPVPADVLKQLNDRFNVQNFSKPEAEIGGPQRQADANIVK